MKKIDNVHDLMVEKQRLQQKLELLKRDMQSEVNEIKTRIKTITGVVSFLTGNHTPPDDTPKSSLLKAGANLGVDLLVGSKLRKAGWFARMLVPPLLRGISSSVISRIKK